MKGILIIPFCDIDTDITEMLVHELRRIFNKVVEAAENLNIPHYAFHNKREQYLSTAFLKVILDASYPEKYEKILGVTDVDLYVPELNFVFGEACDKAAVISLLRLRESFYKRMDDRKVFLRRILTEAVHELGHTFGLKHCNDPHCVMYFSNTISDTDRKGYEFCRNCRNKIGL